MGSVKVELLPAAYSDLDEIFDYIMANNPEAAERILNCIMHSLRRLAYYPLSGTPLLEPSLQQFNFRVVIVSPYMAFYRIVDDKALVYRIVHGTRDYSHLLEEMANSL